MILSHLNTYKYAYLWAIIATGLCGMNGNSLPHFEFSNITNIDKVAHMILFGTETFLIALARQKQQTHCSNFNIIFPAVLIGTGFGILIEILQGTIFTGRSFDYLDMIANSIGCLMAWGILNLKWRKN